MTKMNNFSAFAKSILSVLSVEELHRTARKTKFVQRLCKLMPEDFVSICAFSHENVGETSLPQLAGSLSRESSTFLSKQALDERLNEKGANFLKEVFLQLMEQQQVLSLPSLEDYPFSRIRILDATSFELDNQQPHEALGAKLQLEYEPIQGHFLHTLLHEPRDTDHRASEELAHTIRSDELILRDLGYFSAKQWRKVDQKGAYFITRVPSNMTYWTADANKRKTKVHPEEDAAHLQPGEYIDYGFIQIGARKKNACRARVVVQRLTEEQRKKRDTYLQKRRRKGGHTQSASRKKDIQILATNLTQEEMDAQALYTIYSLRWQVEIIFKTWKSLFKIDQVHEMKPERFRCHLYGTLIQILLSSMITFQCRYYLYLQYGMESSEYKCIHHAKNAIVEEKGSSIYHSFSLEGLIKNVYQNMQVHGKKDHRYHHRSPFDILNITYEEHFRMA